MLLFLCRRLPSLHPAVWGWSFLFLWPQAKHTYTHALQTRYSVWTFQATHNGDSMTPLLSLFSPHTQREHGQAVGVEWKERGKDRHYYIQREREVVATVTHSLHQTWLSLQSSLAPVLLLVKPAYHTILPPYTHTLSLLLSLTSPTFSLPSQRRLLVLLVLLACHLSSFYITLSFLPSPLNNTSAHLLHPLPLPLP